MYENTFRTTYRPLTEAEKGDLYLMKQKAEELLNMFQLYKDAEPRCTALAITKLEEAVMWATKAITK